jgi:hypothetical protein
MSVNDQSPPPGYQGYPGYSTVPPPRPGTSGWAIAGFILSILAAPLGLILSIVGLIHASSGGRKGKGLAISGIVISLLLIGGGIALIATIGDKVTTVADPGCTTGKAAILDNSSKIANSATTKEGLRATITGLDSAATKAKHANVRSAMQALSTDYKALLTAIDTGTQPDPGLQQKITDHANTIDQLCTIGT